MKGLWLVFNIGCIECGVSSNVVGVFKSKETADKIAERLDCNHNWREGGQNSYDVFELGDVDEVTSEYWEYIDE